MRRATGPTRNRIRAFRPLRLCAGWPKRALLRAPERYVRAAPDRVDVYGDFHTVILMRCPGAPNFAKRGGGWIAHSEFNAKFKITLNYRTYQLSRANRPDFPINLHMKLLAIVGNVRLLRMFSRVCISNIPMGSVQCAAPIRLKSNHSAGISLLRSNPDGRLFPESIWMAQSR